MLILGVPHCHLPLLLCTATKDSGEDTGSVFAGLDTYTSGSD